MIGAAELQYGGLCFVEASAFARLAMRRWETGQRLRARHWLPGARAFLSIARDLPQLTVSLTDSPSGDAIGSYLRTRSFGIRWRLLARGVLTLPPVPEDYLRGRHRQAVRTNITRAAREGVRCVPVHTELDKQAAAQRLAEEGWVEAHRVLMSDTDLMVALDRNDQHVGYAQVTVDHTWAMLNTLYAHQYPARYALHTAVVLKLAAARVRYLFTLGENALLLPNGLQYLQRILGYRAVNLRL
jgi:hypothetical protein